jgi:hypothetical protein
MSTTHVYDHDLTQETLPMKRPTRNQRDGQLRSVPRELRPRELRLRTLLFGGTTSVGGGSPLATSLSAPAQLGSIKYPNAAGE